MMSLRLSLCYLKVCDGFFQAQLKSKKARTWRAFGVKKNA